MISISKSCSRAVLTVLFSAVVMIIAFICLPQSSFAQTGTLGTEEPEVYFTYEKDGEIVDGNKLSADTYDVSIHIKGMANSSVLEVTASYNTDEVAVEDTPVSLLSQTTQGFESMGYLLGDGNIVFGFVSTNSDCTVLGDDVVIAKIKMTFAKACDADTVITVAPSPDLTFALADYADGYDDEYSLTKNADKDVDYNGTLYLMTCDVTPAFGHDVRGSLVIATNGSGATNGVPVFGEYTINVYSDEERTNLVATTKSALIDNANSFVIGALDDGTYYATITGEYAVARNDITIVVNGNDIERNGIPVIVCDYNHKDGITGADATAVFQQAAGGGTPYYDLNGKDGVTGADATIVFACAAGGTMPTITIE